MLNNLNRSEILFLVLKYSTKKKSYLSLVDRIFINQERGQLMANKTALELGEEIIFKNDFLHSKERNNKIDFIIEKIKNDNEVFNEIYDEIKEII